MRLAAICAYLLLCACGEKGMSTSEAVPDPKWDAFVEEFVEDYFKSHPPFAVAAGRHEYAGVFPDWSRSGIETEVQRLRAAAVAVVEFELENPTQSYEQAYLLARIERDLFWLDAAKWPFRNPAFYFDQTLDSLDPSVYLEPGYGSSERRLNALIKYAAGLSQALDQIQENLSGQPLPRAYIDVGVSQFSRLAEVLESVDNQHFSSGSPERQAELRVQTTRGITALRSLLAWFERARASQTDDYGIGEVLFSRMLQATEGVTMSLFELEASGEADLQRNLKALSTACKRLSASLTMRACVGRVQSRKPLEPVRKNSTGKPLTQIFVSHGFTVGWAQYKKELWVPSNATDEEAEIHIGQLLDALLQNVRFLCAIGMHTRGMTITEAEAMFKNLAYQASDQARQQALLVAYDPTTINYTLGKLLFMRLRVDWQRMYGGSSDKLKQFHDALLSQGSPPIPLLRTRLLGSQ